MIAHTAEVLATQTVGLRRINFQEALAMKDGVLKVIHCLIRNTQAGFQIGSCLWSILESLPDDLDIGNVFITVEMSGQSHVLGMMAVPDLLYLIALSICQRCVQSSSLGGFATKDLIYAVDWAVDNGPPFQWRQIPPVGAAFFTITISGPTGKLFNPGNTDPAIAAMIAKTVQSWNTPKDGSPLPESDAIRASYWDDRSEQMQRGGTETWWAAQPPLKSSMSYQCDDRLGSPASIDCAQIDWPRSPSDMLNIEQGVSFLYFNTCFLAIFATAPLVITWEQIQVAVSTLIDICVQFPFQAPQGGRAYFQSQQNQTNGQEQKHKRQSKTISGLNALPPHVNITLFEQLEPWTNPASEVNTCTWKAISSGRSMTSCNPA